MKKIIFCSTLFLIPFLSNGQIARKLRKVVPVITQQALYLNGDFKPPAGSQSRVNYKVDLPANTIEWYYMVTVSGGQAKDNPTLNLVAQLEQLADPSGQKNIDVSAIISPAGAYPCAVYLMNKTNTDAFMQKVDFTGGTFSFIPSGTKENTRNTVVQIKDAIYGSYWLGFKDPGGVGGITIHFEVAAVTEENTTNNSEWSKEIKENLYSFFYENIQGRLLGEEEAKDIAGCMLQQLVAQKTPGDYYAMNQPQKDSFLSASYNICAAKYEEPLGPNYEKASNYGNHGWKEYEKGNIDSAIAYFRMAIALDSSLPMAKANLGLCFLVKSDIASAKDNYEQALAGIRKLKLSSRRKEYLEAVIKNLEEVIKKYPGLEGSKEIRLLYEDELRKY